MAEKTKADSNSASNNLVLGIDIGGTGIKGAPVDLNKGILTKERHRIPTPHPAKPDAVADVVAQVVQHFGWKGAVGCTFPAIIKEGVAHSAANVDKAWVGADARSIFERKAKCHFEVVNDADAAGMAEMEFGAGKGHNKGVVIMVTLGTGIGSAIFLNGTLVPNAEIGHLEIRGKDSERRASDHARVENDWSWKKWAKNVDEYLRHIEFLFSPDLIIIGGGVSKKAEKFIPRLNTKVKVVPAQMMNDAGIVGGALAAKHVKKA
jgi:polyphosphate glucokinase